MKLTTAVEASLIESRFFTICEAGEGPRWSFDYSTWKQDPHPDILLLGAYRHPNTGNNLVGGINLNYLNVQQRQNLARVLPQIMKAGNLYSRYHAGRRLLPDIFDNFYRTYNANNIRGVETDVLYPKYGFLKTASDYLKKKVSGLFKSPEQRAKDAEPEYPQDLTGMNDMLNNVVQRLGQQVQTQPEPVDTPEMQAARKAFQQYKLDRAKSLQDIEQQEAEPLQQATLDYQAQQLQQGQAQPEQVDPGVLQRQPAPQEPTPQQLATSFNQEKEENRKELLDPKNDINLDEAIRYFSPKTGRYIMESVCIAEESSGILFKRLQRLVPQLLAAAQQVYDEWERIDEFDEGGICDLVSSALSGVLSQHGIDSTEGGHDGDNHSYIIAYDDADSFIVDVDPDIYEVGSGYSWTKIPNVVFDESNLIIEPTDRPDWI